MIKYKVLDGSIAFKYELGERVEIDTNLGNKLFETIDRPPVCLYWDGTLVLLPPYRWDGATACPDWLTGMLPPLVHDALYGLIQAGLLDKSYRRGVDKLFLKLVRTDIGRDTNLPRRWLRRASTGLIWACVRMFGWRHVKSMAEKGAE